jgi:outer membrane protein assembly factor BamB
MMATDAAVTPSAETKPAKKIRWWPVAAAIGVGAALQAAATLFLGENRSYLEFVCVFVIWPLTVFLLLLWWTFWSRLPWQTRGLGLLVLAIIAGSSLAAFRFDEFDGAMIPRFSPRWQPTKKDRAAEFFKSVEAGGSELVKDEIANERLEPTEGDWPAFRGSNRDDVVIGESLRTDWDARPPMQLWKHPIGSGWGSFAVIGRRAWTLEQRGENELCVCYDVETGRELWSHADAVRFSSVQGGVGPCSTPTVHDGKVFTQGGTGILNCLDAATGQRVWTRNTLEDAGSKNLEWGQCGSPLIVDDLVIVNPGGNDAASRSKNSSVIAYRRDSGEKAWATEGRQGSYSSPHLATLAGERQVLIFDGPGVVALRPATGERLWHVDWVNGPEVNAAQPLVVDETSVLIGSGYGKGAILVGLQPQPEKFGPPLLTTSERWQSTQFKLKFNGAVRRGDDAYGLDEGMLTGLNLKTGKRLWKQGRYGYGQLLLVEDKLLILSEEGDVVLVPATPETPRELARFHAIDGKTWNHPALSRGRLLVRNSDEAACFDLR